MFPKDLTDSMTTLLRVARYTVLRSCRIIFKFCKKNEFYYMPFISLLKTIIGVRIWCIKRMRDTASNAPVVAPKTSERQVLVFEFG